MGKWIPRFWIVGGGIGILALVLYIDALKSKVTRRFRNNHRLGRNLSSTDA